MITIQSGMLIALGFLAAALLGLLVAPALWRRAVRLTTRRIKNTMPLSEMEIEADRDRIRAEYAIKMHKLETLVEQVKLAGARQHIEINRRDAQINTLEAELETLKATYEEAQNARRVLEQTIADRLPRVESRLTEAKSVLHAREREVTQLTQTAEKQLQALAAASAINAEQKAEIERLGETLSSQSSRFGDGDTALRAEIAALRTKTRDQAQLLERLQSLAGRPSVAVASGAVATDGTGDETQKRELEARQSDLERELAASTARNEDQAAELARLRAAIAVFERNADGEMLGSIRESRLALKARVQALEAQSVQQGETVARLRNELAAANERLARQAAHFTDELKRLGTGGSAAQARRRDGAALRPSLAERVSLASADLGQGGGSPDTERDGPTDASTDGDAETAAVDPVPIDVPMAVQETNPSPGRVEPQRGKKRAVAGRPRLLDRIAGLSRTP